MQIEIKNYGFSIDGITADELFSLKKMIQGASLNERRVFNNLLEQIKSADKRL